MDELEYPDESADSSPAEAAPPTDEGHEDIAAGGETPDADPESQVPFHEHPRWKQVHGELKSYKALGATPEQILELGRELQFYRELDARNKQSQRQESRPPTDEERQNEASMKAARAALEQVAPEIKEVGHLKQILTMLGHQAQQHRESLDTQAHSALAGLMSQVGLPTADEQVVSMAKRMVPIIQDDQRLLQLYFRDPNAAVKQAWDAFTKDIDLIASRRQGARLQQKGASLSLLPRAQQGGGGSAPPRGEKPAQTIDELFKRERRFLTGKE